MQVSRLVRRWLGIAVVALAVGPVGVWGQKANTKPSKIEIDKDGVVAIDGRRVFPVGYTFAPAPGTKTPDGKEGLQEFAEAGALLMRTGPMGGEGAKWDDAWIAREKEWMDAAAKYGLYTAPWLKELSHVEPANTEKEQKLRQIIRMFKDHPGMGFWKGEDEPEWGKKQVGPLRRAYEIIHEEDPNHPVWIVQAPRGTVQTLKAYADTYDVGGIDIYPISYPPGAHTDKDWKNKDISMVGEFTRIIREANGGKKPYWMTLQVAFSGTTKPGRTLRFPTFHEQRFMAYQAIVNGARGLIYFGGTLPTSLNERDTKLGWNWTFWERVQRPLMQEIGDKSPIRGALVAPASKLPVKNKDKEIEFCVREDGKDLYVIACNTSGSKTLQTEFTGLPPEIESGDIVFEGPRKVKLDEGAFKDWIGPYEVHVYKFARK
jgi:hypothetical protein